jgi:hypothetical protein
MEKQRSVTSGSQDSMVIQFSNAAKIFSHAGMYQETSHQLVTFTTQFTDLLAVQHRASTHESPLGRKEKKKNPNFLAKARPEAHDFPTSHVLNAPLCFQTLY